MRRRQLLVPAAAVLGLLAPTVPAAQAASPGEPQKITGIVQTIIREQPRGHQPDADDAEDTVKVLNVGTKVVPLTDGSLPTTEDGTKVSLTVAPASDGTKRVLSATTLATPVASAISPVHQVYLALVRPVGVPADPNISDASGRSMVNRVSQYWSEQTGSKVSFIASEVQSYQSAHGCSDTYAMWSEALQRMPSASGAGRHLVVVAPDGAGSYGCDYGLGSLGAVEASGNKVFVSGLNQSLLAHELGHNLGLEHSNALRCGTAQDAASSSSGFPNCVLRPYDDLFDVMGYSGTNFGEGNLNAVHLDGMNLLPAAVRKIAANSGVTTARLTPLSTTTDGRTLKVTDPNGARYYVEYRTNSGRDAVASINFYRPSWGVRVLRDDPAAAPSAGSYELDASPTSVSNDYNRSIPVGGTFTAASNKVTIKVTAADAAGATVTVTNGTGVVTPPPPPPPPPPPVATVPANVTMSIPTRASVGTTITARTRVTDLAGRATANWVVTLQKMQKGTTTWTSIRSLRTSSTGTASHAFANGLSGSYRWVTASATGAPSKYSPTVAVSSIPVVNGVRPATTVTRGSYLTITGSVSSVPAPVVYIQYRYLGGAWVTGPRATVTGTSVSGRIAFDRATTVHTRLYIVPGTAYLGSISPYHATLVR